MAKNVGLFNMPELHEYFIIDVFEYLKEGNTEVRCAAANCFSKILKY
jgi:hypothetical protein